jgi:3-deoxy-manno-octulosonate cytidylyltransferase (CMP-KDO synthetase)
MEGAGAFRVVIPARYASTRLPGKPLRLLAGKPMIQWVWENAVRAGAEIVVATDDARIAHAVEAFGGSVMLTSDRHGSGTERLAEVAERLAWPADAIVVNLQGDEPFVGPELLARVAAGLEAYAEAGIATLATPIEAPSDVFDPNLVKVVRDARGFARYFSRAPIPWVRGAFAASGAPPDALPRDVPFLRHLGLYAYRAGTLLRLAKAEPCAVEQAEALEQLRALHLGIGIHVAVIEGAPGHGVDTEEDLQRVAAMLGGV